MKRIQNCLRAGLFAWALAGAGLFGHGVQHAAMGGASALIMGFVGAGTWAVRRAFGWG